MNIGVVFELACVIAYITILAGGRNTREKGWKILAALLSIVAASELIAMALVVCSARIVNKLTTNLFENLMLTYEQAYLYDHDNRFFVGWELDKSWILCTVSWTVLVFDVVGIIAAALFLPPEDDYEPIPEPE